MSVEFGTKEGPVDTTRPTTDVNPAEGLHDMRSGRPAASIGSWLETSLSHAEPHIQDGIDAARFVWNNPGDALSGAAAGLGEFASDAWGDAVDRAVLIGGPLVMGEDRWNEAAGNQLLNGAEYVGDMNQEVDELLAAYEQDGLAGLSGELIGRYGAEVSAAAAGAPLGGKLGSVIKGVSMTAKGQKLKKLVDKALDKLKKADKKDGDEKKKDTGAFIGKASATKLVDGLIANGTITVAAGKHGAQVRKRLIKIASSKTGYETLSRIANRQNPVTLYIMEGDEVPRAWREIYNEGGVRRPMYVPDGEGAFVRTADAGDMLNYTGPRGELVDTREAFFPVNPQGQAGNGIVLMTGPGPGAGGSVLLSLKDANTTWIHELGHAANASEGVYAANLASLNFDLDPTTRGTDVRVEELQNIWRVDNAYRAEMGLPLRDGHGHMPATGLSKYFDWIRSKKP